MSFSKEILWVKSQIQLYPELALGSQKLILMRFDLVQHRDVSNVFGSPSPGSTTYKFGVC